MTQDNIFDLWGAEDGEDPPEPPPPTPKAPPRVERVEPPSPREPETSWEHHALYETTRDLLFEAPLTLSLNIQGPSGMSVTGIQALGPALAADLEEGLVEALNNQRPRWDPKGRYSRFGFVRQPQTFPDILFQRLDVPGAPLFGIELKSWYLLANEEEPSLRFKTAKEVCADADLLVVYPWCFSEVLYGVARVFKPYVCLARWAAEYRDYHWTHLMRHKKTGEIRSPKRASPYPSRGVEIHARPTPDHGGNFGRMARWGILEEYIKEIDSTPLALRIAVREWRMFFSAVSPQDQDLRWQALTKMRREIHRTVTGSDEETDKLCAIGRDAIDSHLRHK